MRVDRGMVRFSDWAPPRFVKALSQRPYSPDNTPQNVWVAYHARGFTAVLRSWSVCEGVEPELGEDEVAFLSLAAVERWLEEKRPGLTRIDPTANDPVRVMATWV